MNNPHRIPVPAAQRLSSPDRQVVYECAACRTLYVVPYEVRIDDSIHVAAYLAWGDYHIELHGPEHRNCMMRSDEKGPVADYQVVFLERSDMLEARAWGMGYRTGRRTQAVTLRELVDEHLRRDLGER